MAHYWLPDATSGTGTGNWSATGATGHWADDEGGTNLGKAAPGTTDDVYFGASAFNGAGQTVTTGAADTARSIDWTGATNSPTFDIAVGYLTYSGSVTLINAMTITPKTGQGFQAVGTGVGRTFTTNGNPASVRHTFIMQADYASVTLVGNITTGTYFYLNRGILNTNGYDIVATNFLIADAGVKVLTLGDSVITTDAWTASGTNITLTANTSTINCSGNFSGGGLTTYNIVNLTGATSTITGNNTFNTLGFTRAGVQTITFTDGSTQTVNSLTRDASTSVKTLQGSGAAGWAITTASGSALLVDYISISRSTASPINRFYAGRHSTDGGNNVAWYFTEPVPITGGSAFGMSLFSQISIMQGSLFKRI